MNSGLFSVADINITGYFAGMHRDMYMIKALLPTVYLLEFNSIVLNTKVLK